MKPTRGRKRVRTFGRADVFSTAMLLPDLHPWLKEFFAASNLIPIVDEADAELPMWEAVPEWSMVNCPLSIAQTSPGRTASPAITAPTTSQSDRVAAALDHMHVLATEAHAAVVRAVVVAAPPPTPTLRVESQIPAPLPAPPPLPPIPRSTAPSPTPPDPTDSKLSVSIAASFPPSVIPAFAEPSAGRRASSPPATPAIWPAWRAGVSDPCAIRLSGTRRSSSPTPFNIPVATATAVLAVPSSNFLRLSRPAVRPAPAAPNFLHTIQQQLAALPAAGRATLPRIANATSSVRDALRADGTDAPWFSIPVPYSELLIVALAVTPIERCWRAFGWQAWRACVALYAPMAERPRAQRLWHIERMTPQDALTRICKWMRIREFAYSRLFADSRHAWAHTATFAGVLLLILLPVKLLGLGSALVPEAKGRVLGAAASVLGDFHAGGRALATSSFTDAITAFDRARATIAQIPTGTSARGTLALRVGKHLPIVGAPLRTATSARDAGLALADASSAAARGLALLATLDPAAPEAHAYLRASRAAFTTAQARAAAAATALRNGDLPFADTVAAAADAVRRADALLAVVEGLAGLDRERRILLIFQNPAELRPTGGFIGSVALLKVRNGTVTTLEVPGGGAYDVSGMTRMRVLPPEPLRLLNPTWQFHDANWFPDFPTSAAKLQAFAEASGWPTVDAVVAVQAPFLADVLRVTGPVVVDERTLTADDVLTALTNTVESPAARASGAPKAIIGDLAPVLLDRLLGMATSGDTANGIALVDLMVRALDARDLQLVFTDDTVQRAVTDAHWDGALRPAAQDALAVVHTNIGGGKSDAVMRDAIAHDARIAADGRTTATITITRTHTGTAAPVGAPPTARLTGMQNVDYLRVYVPRGSTLIAADGYDLPPSDRYEPLPTDALPDRVLLATESDEQFAHGGVLRVTEEFGRTAIGGWLLTKPGSSRTVTLTIELPLQYERTARGALGRSRPADPQPYTVLIQRQPGTSAALQQSLTIDPAWRVTWSDGTFTRDGATWKRAVQLDRDAYAGMMIAPQ